MCRFCLWEFDASYRESEAASNAGILDAFIKVFESLEDSPEQLELPLISNVEDLSLSSKTCTLTKEDSP